MPYNRDMTKRVGRPQGREQAAPVTLKDSRYQPSRKELRADMTIPASSRQVMKSVVRTRPIQFEK